MRRVVMVCVLAAATAITQAQAQERLQAIDVAVDFADMQGRSVEITGCVIAFATLDMAWCALQTANGRAGNINIETVSMERRLLKFALKNCASPVAREECRTDLRVTVSQGYDGRPLLKKVTWLETLPVD